MKAIILAAGVGSRLRPLTAKKPKCLIKVAGKPILRYQLDAYIKAGVKEVVVVTGYESETVDEFCKHLKGVRVTIVRNEDYESTNNMYSFYMASKLVDGEPFLMSNGDVAIDTAVVTSMVNSREENLIAVERGRYDRESMKVVATPNGVITRIAKDIEANQAFGSSADFYKFSAQGSRIFCEMVRRIVDEEDNQKEWTEIALDRLFAANGLRFAPHLINGMRWVEVDNYEDLAIADRVFSTIIDDVSTTKLFFVDLDGTVHLGTKPIPGAIDVLRRIAEDGRDLVFLSNNSSRSKEDYVERLRALGLAISREQIVLSSDALVAYLKDNEVKRVWPLGTASFTHDLEEAGFEIDAETPEYVLIGYDTELTYEKLRRAALLIVKGVDYLATHSDLVCPTPEGPVPDVGSFLALLKAATGKRPVKIFGKPDGTMVQPVLEKKRIPPERAAVIGDRIYTDMMLAKHTRCKSVLVLSGETSRDAVEEEELFPDLVIPSLADLPF